MGGVIINSYLTVENFTSAEIEVKKSKFIGSVFPVKSSEEAMQFLNRVRAENREARHNVFAYSVREGNYCRFSDDGEPQGTAGKPVLDVVKGFGVTDTLVVVTRYFGGILLGTGGLARAYSDTARLSLENARIVRMMQVIEYTCRFDYTYFGKISSLIPEAEGCITDTVYDDCVNLFFYIPEDNAERFNNALSELTLGKVCAKEVKKAYKPKKI